MEIQTILAPVMEFLPAAGSEDVRALAVLLGAGFLIIAGMLLAARLSGGGRGKAATREAGGPGFVEEAGARYARGPNLDPEEWVSGNVIHLDRQKAVGFIRCDRVKRPVRFGMPALQERRSRAPRVGEKVRFKGRHGARRRPVADVVERAGQADRRSPG